MTAHKPILLAVLSLALVACNKPDPTTTPDATPPDTSATPEATAVTPPPSALESGSTALPPAPPTPADAPPFADKVWKVQASSAVAVDTTYTFLSDGTLVIDSHQGTPAYGQWTWVNGELTMIEEGQSYPTDILKLDDTVFDIRSNNPGQPVTITLVPAVGMPLPPAPVED